MLLIYSYRVWSKKNKTPLMWKSRILSDNPAVVYFHRLTTAPHTLQASRHSRMLGYRDLAASFLWRERLCYRVARRTRSVDAALAQPTSLPPSLLQQVPCCRALSSPNLPKQADPGAHRIQHIYAPLFRLHPILFCLPPMQIRHGVQYLPGNKW